VGGEGGEFVPGVPGLWGGSLGGDGYIVFVAGSGGYSLQVRSGGAPAKRGTGQSAACSGETLQCGSGGRLVAFKRAGLQGARARSPWRRQFLVTHLLEAMCLGKRECLMPGVGDLAKALAPAVVLGMEEDDANYSVCAHALCVEWK